MITVGQLRRWNGGLDPLSAGQTFTVLNRLGEFRTRDPPQEATLWEIFHHDRGVSTGWSTEFLETYSDLLEPVQSPACRGITG